MRICTGTLCYLMGGADLQLLEEYMPDGIAEKVDIKGSSCLNCCNSTDSGKAPFVMVGDTLVAEATIPKVIETIKNELSACTG